MGIRVSKAGRRVPLNAEELKLARTHSDAITRTNANITLKELTAILENLQPDALNSLLNQVSLMSQQGTISSSLLDSINIGGNNAIKQLQSIAPKLVLPAFLPDKVDISNVDSMQNIPVTRVPAWAAPAGKKLPMQLNLTFNRTDPYAIQFAQARAAELIKSIDELTRQSVHKIINDAFVNQIDYRITATRIKNVIGLHPQWADAVVNFENKTFSQLVGQGIKESIARSQASAKAGIYADRLRSARATMISRTEINIAQNEGRLQGWKQAFAQGYIDPASMKMWMTAKDERTCDECGPMDGETAPWNGVFSNGDEVAGRVHPHCRCSMVMLPPDGNGNTFQQDYAILNEAIGWDQ